MQRGEGLRFLHDASCTHIAYATLNWVPQLLACHNDGSVCVWDVTRGELVHTIKAHAGPINHMLLHEKNASCHDANL